MIGDAWGRTRYVSRRSIGLLAQRRRLLLRRPAAGGGQGRPRRGRPERGRDRGQRPPAGDRRRAAVQETEGRVYQQIEIPSGPFRRVVELQVEVDAERATATYEDGVLQDRAAAARPRARPPDRVPIGPQVMEGPRSSRSSRRRSTPRTRSAPASRCPRRCRSCRCATSVTFPDTLTPLAVGQERSIKLVDDVLGANRMLVMVASRDPENEEPGPDDLYDVGVVGVVARMMKVPDGTLRILVQGDPAGPARRLRHRASPTWSRGSASCPT